MMINQDKKIEPEVFQKSGAGASQNRTGSVTRFAEPVEDDLLSRSRTLKLALSLSYSVINKQFRKNISKSVLEFRISAPN